MLRTNPSILSEMCRSAQRVLISIATLLVVLGCSDRGGGSGGGGGGNGGGDSNAAPYISRIELIPANPVMLPNQNLQIQAVAWMSDGSSKDVTDAASWTTSAPAVANFAASPSPAGTIVAVGPGLAQLSITVSGVTKTVDVSVSAATLSSIEISSVPISAPKGVVQQLTATGVYSDGSVQDVTSLATWASVDSSVVSVADNAGLKGQATMAGVGSTTVSAVIGAISGQVAVTVTAATLVSIQSSPSTLNLPLGTSQQLQIIGVYSDGTTADLTLTASFSSSNSAVLEVNKNSVVGLLAAKSLGAANVTIAVGSVSLQISAQATNAVLSSLDLDPENISLANGNALSLTVTGIYSDGSSLDLTSQATRTIANSALVYVSDSAGSKGRATAQAVGSTTLKAAYGGIEATTPITVTAATLSSLQVTPSLPTIANGLTQQFQATGVYSDGSTADLTSSATWASSSAANATISNGIGSKGLATAKSAGTSTISASVGAVSASTTLTVSAATLVSIQFSPSAPSIANGNSLAISATGIYSDNSTVDLSSSVTWSSSNQAVATVSNTGATHGTVTAVGVGTATVTATLGGVQSNFVVTVTNAVLNSLAITPVTLSTPKGVGQQFTVIGTYSDGSTADLTSSASWSSSNSAVMSVGNGAGNKGLASADGAGTATVTATVGAVSANASVTVNAATLSSIDIQPSSLSLPLGQSYNLSAIGTYSDGSTSDITDSVTWSSSNGAKASVSNAAGSKGRVSATGQGSATITAALSGHQAQLTVSTTAATLVSIDLNPAGVSLARGTPQQFSATGTYSDGSTMDITSTVTWASSDTSVLTVGNAAGTKGLANSLAQGSATVTASSAGVSATATVTVSAAVLNSITVSPASASLPMGVSQQLTAMGTYSDGSVVDITESVSWSSTDAVSVSVSNAAGTRGRAVASAVGNSTVTASVNGQSANAAITVTAATLDSVQLTPAVLSIANGVSQQFTATGTYSDGSTQDITSTATWASSDTSVMSISNGAGNRGLALAKALGTANVSATLSGVSGSAGVTVTAATLSSLEINPSSLTLPKGLGQQMSVTGLFSDSTTSALTTSATWSSSNAAVFSVSNSAGSKGQVTANGVGTATLTAAYGGQQAQISITVTAATLSSITVSASASSLANGTNLQFAAAGVYSDGSSQDITSSVSWASSDAAKLSVSNTAGSKGLASAHAVGAATITATLSGVTGGKAMTVTNAVITGIALSPAAPSIAKGLTQSFSATATYSDGSTGDVKDTATWTTSDNTIATVSNAAGSKGVASGIAQGNATITATLSGVSGQATVSVTAATLASIAVTHSGTNLAKGLVRQLTATGTYTDGSTADLTNSVVWSSGTPAVITVSNAAGTKGQATAILAAGSSTITATLGAVSGTTTVTATAAVLVSVAVTPHEVWVILGAVRQLTATGTYSDGTTANLTTVADWSSSNINTATVNNTTNKGRAAANLFGDTTITADVGGITGTMTFHSVLF